MASSTAMRTGTRCTTLVKFGCVVRRQKRELCSQSRAHARDLPWPTPIVVSVDLELDRLAGTNLGKLGLLECRHPDARVSDDAEQWWPGATSCPTSTCFLETSPDAGAVMRV